MEDVGLAAQKEVDDTRRTAWADGVRGGKAQMFGRERELFVM